MSRHNEITPKTIDEYIAMQPEAFRPALHELRSIIRSLAPQAIESISYQVPCFKHHYMLVGIGVNRNFSSLYTMSPPLVKKMKDDLKGVKLSGATIHFSPGVPLPVALIEKIVRARIQENEVKAMSKK
ncbi:iron chaperone [Mucilaginibacter ginsenosidivorans]|nr:DUF1801 domain-containing protein [Mucilaginibacter ginsenosidivorans]